MIEKQNFIASTRSSACVSAIVELFRFYRILFSGVVYQVTLGYLFFKKLWDQALTGNRLQFAGCTSGLFAILLSWSGYQFSISENYRFVHSIYTDDFLLYFICISAVFVTLLLSQFFELWFLPYLNASASLLMFTVAIKQLVDMHELLPTHIASLKLGFYVFYLSTVVNIVGLALGLLFKPRAPEVH